MMMRTGSIHYGDEVISFDIIERPSRKTLGIEVYPDGRVLVLSPIGCHDTIINEKIRLRANWISRQLATFSRYERNTLPRQYISGESHRYLGRQYRLRIRVDKATIAKEHIKLTRGEMLIIVPEKLPPEKVKELLRRWYLNQACEIYEVVLRRVFGTFGRQGFQKPRISVREMRGRWGSLSPIGQMTLNSRLVQAPLLCIEYVIVHELCHLVYQNHSSGFFTLLEQVMPDWQIRKQRLEEALL